MADTTVVTDVPVTENIHPDGEKPAPPIAQILSQDNYNRVLTLKNGKRVSYAECGDPEGFPVVLLVGLAGTRHFAYLYDNIGRESRMRLICPDRPGVGLSDDVDHDDKTAIKWTETLSEMADQLDIAKFGILAQSCGTVYALACAVKIPDRLIGTIHLVSPWVPVSTPGSSKSLQYSKMLPRFILSASSSFIQSMPHLAVSMGSINAFCKGWSEAERNSFFNDGIKEFFEAMLKIKKTENKTGHTNDLLMSLEKDHGHGFEYTQVNYPVQVFHGTKDTMVPLAAMQYMETAMMNCKLTVKDLATHNLICDLDYMKETVFPSLKNSLESSTFYQI